MLARGPTSGRVNGNDRAAQNETRRLISQIFQSDLPDPLDSNLHRANVVPPHR
jgi:hypothetical protein